MTYATVQDLIDRFGEVELIQLTDPTGVAVDTAEAQRALDDAEAEIDTYLRRRYSLPLATPPVLLTRHACDLARFYLHHGEGRQPTEQVRTARDDSLRFLRDVSNNKADLGLDAVGAPVKPASLPEVQAPDRVFTADTLKDFG